MFARCTRGSCASGRRGIGSGGVRVAAQLVMLRKAVAPGVLSSSVEDSYIVPALPRKSPSRVCIQAPPGHPRVGSSVS